MIFFNLIKVNKLLRYRRGDFYKQLSVKTKKYYKATDSVDISTVQGKQQLQVDVNNITSQLIRTRRTTLDDSKRVEVYIMKKFKIPVPSGMIAGLEEDDEEAAEEI